MNIGIIIDAHILHEIRDALVKENGLLYDLINWILDNCGIAITQLIETHWKSKISESDRFFWEWYFSEYHSKRRIREIELKKFNNMLMNKIITDCCLPKDIFVKGYIKAAHSTKYPRYILAEDMDLHDPRYKKEETKTKKRIIDERTGKLCVFLEDRVNIRVGSRKDCERYFAITNGPCTVNPCSEVSYCPHTS